MLFFFFFITVNLRTSDFVSVLIATCTLKSASSLKVKGGHSYCIYIFRIFS